MGGEWNCFGGFLLFLNNCGFRKLWEFSCKLVFSSFPLNLFLYKEGTVDSQGCDAKIDFHENENRRHVNWNIPV
jgi:hypothetical protein